MELTLKTLDFEVRQAGDPQERVLEFIGSTAHVDRYGDVIEVEGWDLKNYQKNPVFLWAHDYKQPPVGKAVKVEKGDQGLLFQVKFPTAEEYAFADTIFKLYLGGYLRATSVGFQDLEREPITDKEGKQTGWRYKRQELYELSAVPVPANPNALVMAVQKGVVSPQEVEHLTGVPYEAGLIHGEQDPEPQGGGPELLILKEIKNKIDALESQVALLKAPGYDPAQLKAAAREALEEFVRSKAGLDYYSLALNPGSEPYGGRPAGEPDISRILNATQNLHKIVKGV